MNQNIQIRDFIRFCLEKDAPKPKSIGELDWPRLYRFAHEQAIIGIVFEGLKKLSADDSHPTQQLLFKWMMAANVLGKQNLKLNKRLEEVVQFFHQHGFDCCLLKGQGNAMMYPNPFSRTPGDIDLWVDGNKVDVENLCKDLNPKTVISYHHAQQSYKDVELEVHFHPSYAGNFFYNRRLQQYFDSRKKEQMENNILLNEGEQAVAVPTDSFNRVFQMSHLMKHFLYEGVGLRQVIDYYYLLRRGMTNEEKAEEQRILKHLNLYKFATALMYVLHDFLGLEERYLSVSPNKKEGEMLLQAILKSGNFGMADKKYSVAGKGRAGLYFTYIRRSMQFAWHYPSEVIFGRPFVPIWRRLVSKKS